MKLAIYHEYCVLAGQEVGDRQLEQAEADNDGQDCDSWEDGDWFIIEGTPEELRKYADLRVKHARSGGGGSYDRRVANTIYNFLQHTLC